MDVTFEVALIRQMGVAVADACRPEVSPRQLAVKLVVRALAWTRCPQPDAGASA